MKDDDFRKWQAEQPTSDLLEKAREHIRENSKHYGKRWTMSIPPQREDTDMVFSELCRRLEYWQKRCLAAEDYIEESPCDPDINETLWRAYRYWESVKNDQV